MDVVTAGTVVVLVAAEAHATGDTAYTSTTTGTLTVARPGGVVEQGFGVGDAVASGDTHQVNVYTDGYGDGDIVAVARTGNDVVNPMFSRERDG